MRIPLASPRKRVARGGGESTKFTADSSPTRRGSLETESRVAPEVALPMIDSEGEGERGGSGERRSRGDKLNQRP